MPPWNTHDILLRFTSQSSLPSLNLCIFSSFFISIHIDNIFILYIHTLKQSYLIRVDPPVTDEHGFLQADEEGVINRWDIINHIEHLPWTTKQILAMYDQKHNSYAKQIDALNGWNNQYDTGPTNQYRGE